MAHLLIATGNPGKRQEMTALLRELNVTLLTPDQAGIEIDVPETGSTYAENAALKARAFAQASGMLTLADDSGLEVEALGGLPGIHSARFSPEPGATDADRRRRLLEALASHPRPWRARFYCVVAIATPEGDVHFAEGECPGEIIPVERGQSGFGYDPIFLLPGRGQTMAELDAEEKNRLSHRARAIQAALPVLTVLINK